MTSQISTALLGFLALTWTRATSRESRREKLWPTLGLQGPGGARDSPGPIGWNGTPPGPLWPDGAPADEPALPTEFRLPAPAPWAQPAAVPAETAAQSRPALPAAERLATLHRRRAGRRRELLGRAAPAPTDDPSAHLVGLLLAGGAARLSHRPLPQATEQPARSEALPERPVRPMIPLEPRRASLIDRAAPFLGVPAEFRQQAAFSVQPGEPPGEPAMLPLEFAAPGAPPMTRIGPMFQAPPSAVPATGPGPEASPAGIPGPAAPSARQAPGAAPAPPRSLTALELLREQLTQILKDDALRHGINLKE